MLEEDMAGAQDTIYLCNFRVSVDGEWLCLKELQDVEFSLQDSMQRSPSPPLALSGINHHHHHHHNDHHRQQQLPDQRELRDIMPPSPPPLQHVSSLCLYSMFLHYSLHFSRLSFVRLGNIWKPRWKFLHQSILLIRIRIDDLVGRVQVSKLWLFISFLFFFSFLFVRFGVSPSSRKFILARLITLAVGEKRLISIVSFRERWIRRKFGTRIDTN